ncbi:MAG: hypothetical protein HOP34_03765 [Methylococcaceae bacterium]|nr:hypothetical protein [Methylococcaceae bacterium]
MSKVGGYLAMPNTICSGHPTKSGRANIIIGNNWSNKLDGGAGNDIIYGGEGGDLIFGGIGNDMIYGQVGSDILTGGAGNDIFVFAWGDGQDTIKGFGDKVGNQDSIDLSGFTISSKDISIESSGGNTIIGIEGVNNLDFQLTLIGVKASTLDAGDFIF